LESVPPGTGQPAPVTKVTLSQFTNNHVVRSHNVSGITQKSGRISFWADPALKERLRAVALREGLSISATCAAFLRKSLQQDIDLEYSATLEPVFERLIGKFMRGISTRLAWLLARVSIDSGQTRSLVTNILGRQQGMTTDLLRSIVKQSADTARGNITRRTPQLEDVIESVEKWLLTDDPPDNKDRGGDN
jgi:hypothetical protein